MDLKPLIRGLIIDYIYIYKMKLNNNYNYDDDDNDDVDTNDNVCKGICLVESYLQLRITK